MKNSNNFEAVFESEEIEKDIKGIIEILKDAVFEEVPPSIKIITGIMSTVFTFREKLLISKLRIFLKGAFLSGEDRIKISQLFDTSEEKLEYIQILIKTLDDIETEVKVKYLINLTRALLVGIIEDKNDYYRMVNCVRTILEQDLKYVSDNINSEFVLNNVQVDFLFQASLMYKSFNAGTMRNEVDKYSFTPLARMLNECALNYDEDNCGLSNRIRSLKNTNHQGTTAGLSYRYIDDELHFNENR